MYFVLNSVFTFYGPWGAGLAGFCRRWFKPRFKPV